MDSNLESVLPLARADLGCYAKLIYPGYELAKHHRLLINELEKIERGEITRLMVFMPPRHGKTLSCSQLFPAWYLGKHADRSVIYCSYSQEISDDSGRKVRNLLADPIHRAVFPDSILAPDSTAQSRFHTTCNGSYFAVGRGGPITGRGGSLVIVDDALKDADEARSEIIRRTLKEWFGSVVYTRLAPGGAVICVSTRWHEDDLCGWLLREHADQNWKVLSLAAIAEEGDAFRKPGDALWGARYPVEVLEATRKQLGSAAFTSLYQQKPTAAEGGVFKREWCRSYREAPASFNKIVQSWDTAAKTGEQNDFSVCSSWGVTATGYYLLALWRNRVEFPALRRQVALQAEAWKPSQILIEDTSAGQSLIQELKAATRFPVKAIKVDKDKRLRAETVTPLFEAGRIFFPESAPWLNDFMDELAAFPNGTHDDCVDSVTQALNYLRGRPDSSGFFSLIKAQLKSVGLPIDPSLLSEDEKEAEQQKKTVEQAAEQTRFQARDARPEDITTDEETGRIIYWNRRTGEWHDYASNRIIPSEPYDGEA